MIKKIAGSAAVLGLLIAGGLAAHVFGLQTTEAAKVDQGNPAHPSDLTASVSNGQVHLTWQDNSNNESSFWVMRSRDNSGNNWISIGHAAPNGESYTDRSAQSGTYYYRVRANREDGASHSWSNMIKVTVKETPKPQPKPQPKPTPNPGNGQSAFYVPNRLAVRENSTANIPNDPVVDLTWKDQSYSNSGYIIERSTNNGSWKAVTRVGKDEENWRDFDVRIGSSYAYRLKAYGTKGGKTVYSHYSEVKSVTVR